MLAKDRDRAIALGKIITEDISMAMSIPPSELDVRWGHFAESVGLFVYAQGELERAACTGALVYAAARLP